MYNAPEMEIRITSNASKVLNELNRIRPRAIGFAWDKSSRRAAVALQGELHRAYRAALPRKEFTGRGRNFPRGVMVIERIGAARSRTGFLAPIQVRSGKTPESEKILRRMLQGGIKHPAEGEYLWVPFRKGGKQIRKPANNQWFILDAHEGRNVKLVMNKRGQGIALLKRTTKDTGQAGGMRPRLVGIANGLSASFTVALRKELSKAIARNKAGSRRV